MSAAPEMVGSGDPAQDTGPAPTSAAGAADLAVIVPHYNDPARLELCLKTLAPQIADRPGTDCVVVDNASPCDLAPLRAAFPAVRWASEPRKGAAAARNRGVTETSAPYLAFLDCDCIPAADWVATAARLAGTADILGGRIETFDETSPPKSGAEAVETVFAFHQKTYIEKEGFSVTANLVTSRAVFEHVGPLKSGLSEDMDWCFRAGALGYRIVYADDLRVAHPTRRDWPALLKKLRRTNDERFYLYGTGARARVLWALRAVAVFAMAFLQAPKLFRDPRLAGGERWRGAVTLIASRGARATWMMQQAFLSR